MGNRACIRTKNKDIDIYLHWNGGRDSVEPFLYYCKLKGYRPPERDNYGWARLCQVIGNFFGGSTSIGVLPGGTYDGEDNGVYIIENWEIVERDVSEGYEEQQEYDFHEMLKAIDEAQPEEEQLGKLLDCTMIDSSSLKSLNIGDKIYQLQPSFEPKWKIVKVLGRGDSIINGRDMTGVPFTDLYGRTYYDSKQNPNNYLIHEKVFKIEPNNKEPNNNRNAYTGVKKSPTSRLQNKRDDGKGKPSGR